MARALPLILMLAAATATAAAQTRLEGLVLSPLDEPVPGARVELEVDGAVIAHTFTDGSGVFAFARCPRRYVVVRATTAAPDVGGAEVDMLLPFAPPARIRLMPARAVVGVVRDADGNPVAGAWVGANAIGDPRLGFASCSTRSGDDGSYRLSHVAMGAARVRAWHPGHSAFQQDLLGTGDDHLDCKLARPRPPLVFTLVGCMRPGQARLHVTARWCENPMPLPPELANPEPGTPGQWHLAGWATADELEVWPELANATFQPARQVVAPNTSRLSAVFRDTAAGALDGCLIAAEGAAVSGLELVVTPIAPPHTVLHGNATRRTTRTAANGAFRVQDPGDGKSRYALAALAPDVVLQCSRTDATRFSALPGTRAHPLAMPARAATVQCVDANGAPVRGAVVRVTSANAWMQGGRSDAEGLARVWTVGLLPGALLHVQASAAQAWGWFEQLAPATEVWELGQLTLDPLAALEIAVHDDNGKPQPGVPVRVRREGNTGTPEVLLVTDRTGRVRAHLVPAVYRATALGSPNSEGPLAIVAGVTTRIDLGPRVR